MPRAIVHPQPMSMSLHGPLNHSAGMICAAIVEGIGDYTVLTCVHLYQ